MSVFENIRNTLCLQISLHEQLRNALKEEFEYVDGNAVECIAEKAAQKREIELEIERTNRTLVKLFGLYETEFLNIKPARMEEITLLIKDLHDTIKDNLNVIENTVETIKNTRKKILMQLKDYDSNKVALNAYTNINPNVA